MNSDHTNEHGEVNVQTFGSINSFIIQVLLYFAVVSITNINNYVENDNGGGYLSTGALSFDDFFP